jgi:tetratricopeptide (TPR) repeat protein
MELYEKAIPDLKLAISLGTDDKDYDETLSRLNKAYLGRGQQHLNACRNLEAIDDFTKAASSKNLIVKAYEGRATAFTNLGKMEEAKADIAKANYIREEQEHAKKNSHD